MDFAAFLIVPLAVVVASAVMVVSHWSGPVRKRAFFISLGMSFLLSVLLLRPWEAITAAEWPFMLMSLGLVALWAAGGTVVGMAIGMLLVKVAGLALRRLRRSN
jgi:hypothetical protein